MLREPPADGGDARSLLPTRHSPLAMVRIAAAASGQTAERRPDR